MSDETRRGGRRDFLRVAAGSAAALALGHPAGPGGGPARHADAQDRLREPADRAAGRLRRDRQLRRRRHSQGGAERPARSRGQSFPVEVLVRDSQSDPNRAAEVASRLILSDKVDLMLVASTPETTNPVSDQCEANGTPCVSSVCPWQPWFFGRGGKPETGFKSTYHFFWGLEDIIGVFVDMWNTLPTNKVVGALWPNDGDGNAWGDPQRGLPARAGQGRLHARRSRAVPEPDRRLLRADLRLQEARRSRSSPACRSRRTGRRSGSRPPSRASSPRSPPSARRCCSRARSRRWATWATACPPRCGGRRGIRSSRR